MFWLWQSCTSVCQHVHVCIMTDEPTTPSFSAILDCKASLLSPQPPSLHHHHYSFLLPQHKQPFWDPRQQFPSPRQRCWKPLRGQCTRSNTHHCQSETIQWKANMSAYATVTTTRKTDCRYRVCVCAPLRNAGGTCPFKIHFSQLVGAELSGLA